MLRVISIIIFLAISCKTANVYTPSLAELNLNKFAKIPLEELLKNKGRYHGQFIETEGFFHSAAEETAIYYNSDVYFNGKAVAKYRQGCGLWLDFYPSYPFPNHSFDSVLVSVRGFFDTTKTGHVGGCYYAALTNAYQMEVVNNKP